MYTHTHACTQTHTRLTQKKNSPFFLKDWYKAVTKISANLPFTGNRSKVTLHENG